MCFFVQKHDKETASLTSENKFSFNLFDISNGPEMYKKFRVGPGLRKTFLMKLQKIKIREIMEYVWDRGEWI